MSTAPTIFGYPVTLTMEMPNGEMIACSDAIEITNEFAKTRMEINPERVSEVIGAWEQSTAPTERWTSRQTWPALNVDDVSGDEITMHISGSGLLRKGRYNLVRCDDDPQGGG
jgi:hypothetical protein